MAAVASGPCHLSNCTAYGLHKLYDGKYNTGEDWDTLNAAVEQSTSQAWAQLDLGSGTPLVTAVRLVSRTHCCLEQSNGLSVFLSNSTEFQSDGSVLCANSVTFDEVEQVRNVACFTAARARYVTVQRADTQPVALQELAAYELPLPGAGAGAGAGAGHAMQRALCASDACGTFLAPADAHVGACAPVQRSVRSWGSP